MGPQLGRGVGMCDRMRSVCTCVGGSLGGWVIGGVGFYCVVLWFLFFVVVFLSCLWFFVGFLVFVLFFFCFFLFLFMFFVFIFCVIYFFVHDCYLADI